MRAALKDRPIMPNDPPDGMVKVSVSANGTLIADGGGSGITEYVKVEDLERMQNYTDYNTDDTLDEEAFDIF
jgi:penicillin-binding protein 1A